MRRYEDPLKVLREVFQHEDFRLQQRQVIDSLLNKESVLVVMPTGGGKSLCYQVPALCLDGLAIVVSPLVALMRDQVNKLRTRNIQAAALNHTCTAAQYSEIMRAIQYRQLDLLYVSPEKLFNENFFAFLQEIDIAFFAIDEAHCIAQWGYDFRPEYLRIRELHERFVGIPRIALTATADHLTRQDILKKLSLDKQVIASFLRDNLSLQIHRQTDKTGMLKRFLALQNRDASGIIYCNTRAEVDNTHDTLVRSGAKTCKYHAGCTERLKVESQDRFLHEKGICMVATIAFGMGIDKPNVRFVAHFGLPKSVEAYYQEIGRAGRDGQPSSAWMVYNHQDISRQMYHLRHAASQAGKSAEKIRHSYYRLEWLLGLCESAYCRQSIILRYFGEKTVPREYRCGICDNCRSARHVKDYTRLALNILDCVTTFNESCTLETIHHILSGKLSETIIAKGHHRHPLYRNAPDLTPQVWKMIARQLQTLGLITFDAYGKVRLGEESSALIEGKNTFMCVHP